MDIEAGDRAVDLIKETTRATFTSGVLSGIGGFGGLFSLEHLDMDDPVLVSGTDGVGTKLKVAFAMDIHDTVGIDAVAMCVNDIICCGAKPLFFLDYLGIGTLAPERAAQVVAGVAQGCKTAGCALIGGEMAEMPDIYGQGEYDLVGFSVGVVSRKRIIDGSRVKPGHAILAMPSSGVHSNGFSLIRKIVEVAGLNYQDEIPELGGTLGAALLEPTLIYAREIQAVTGACDVLAIAHITGGGLEANINRVLPENTTANIDWSTWRRPAVFDFLQKTGDIDEEEMRHVFNLGIGMAVVVSEGQVDAALGAIPSLIRCGTVQEI